LEILVTDGGIQLASALAPDNPRWRFRTELLALRLELGLSEEAAANRAAWPTSRIVQIENGEIPVSPEELVALLEAFGIADRARIEAFVGLARAAAERIWWVTNKYLPDPYIELISAEADATRITHFHPTFVPGLLQTRAYATAITLETTLKEMPAGMAEELVEVRMQRQAELLAEARSVEFLVLIDETALRRRVGSAATMREQLDQLVAFVDNDRVALAIVPRVVDSHPGLLGAFMLLEYHDSRIGNVLCFDGPLGNVVVRSRPDLIAAYRALAERLLRVGLIGEPALASIQAAQREFAGPRPD
jgi:transcriptional regulator with XRE-family HTH domain